MEHSEQHDAHERVTTAQAVANSVASELGIDTRLAEVLPEHKEQKVAELLQQGR